ncbi:hypothetical protein [Microcoleus sp. Pol10D4]|uniref:hypothetical protein n=1 Tax=Microcoleus sp. Pol10D4 TaxID=3055387 RepID=UPI002FCE8EE5
MSLPYLTKIDNSKLNFFIHPDAIPHDRPSLKLINRLRWDRLNVAPELDRLYRYYRNTCSLANKTQGFEPAISPETYEEIGKLLAQMWSIDRLTEVKQLKYYSRGKG